MVWQAFVDTSIGVLGILNYGVSLAELNGIVGVVSSVIDIVVLAIALTLGMRTYQTYRNVQNYDSYKDSVDRELEPLTQKIATPRQGKLPPG
jgi:hypothetical protein